MTTPTAATSTGPAPKYDAFLSYKHGNPDEGVARDLLGRLEADGYKVAIDKRDFVSHAAVPDEMERYIRESGFTIAIVSARYLGSGFTDEETVIQRTLDMTERRRRLIPWIIEQVHLPTWLFGRAGIDATESNPLIAPYEKLKRDLGPPNP
jgi:hypothetical protein